MIRKIKIKEGHGREEPKNQKGQTLVEFVFLIAVIVGMSLVVLKTSNTQISKIWQKMVYVISEREVTYPL